MDRFRSTVASPLAGVSAEAWARFVKALEVQPIRSVSESGGFGSYDMRPRRLVELGYAMNPRYAQSESGRWVFACDFVPPWTVGRFLGNPLEQYRVLVRSVTEHHAALVSGQIKRPDDVSLAGALAILHVGGKGALASWPDLFGNTRARYEAAQGAF